MNNAWSRCAIALVVLVCGALYHRVREVEPVSEPKVNVGGKVEPIYSKINKDIEPVYWTLRFMLPPNQRRPKGLVVRLIKKSVNMIPASMTYWLLRMRERLARGTIDSTEAESMADGKSVEDLWLEGREEDTTRQRSAATCVHLSPSCMDAMRALDRSRPARPQRWSPEPAVPFTDVVEMAEEDVIIPLLKDLRARVANATSKKERERLLLAMAQSRRQSVFTDLVENGAYRSAVLFAQVCAEAGSSCADEKLKNVAWLDNPIYLTPFIVALRKWGSGSSHHAKWSGRPHAERILAVMSRPLDLTWTLPAMHLAIDVLAEAASDKLKRMVKVYRKKFVRGMTRDGSMGYWDLDLMTQHIEKVRPKRQQCSGDDCCDIPSVTGPLTADKVAMMAYILMAMVMLVMMVMMILVMMVVV